jgi:DNA ligase-1
VTLLADVVRTSTQVAGTASRLAKTRLIADCLKSLGADEVEIAIPYLSGDPRQGKLALGHATLQSVLASPAGSATLTLREVDSAFSQLKSTKGKGSAASRSDLLRNLFRKATPEEQDFLVRLIVGELRQGALEGVMLDAVAAAANLPPAEIRRAATFAGGVAPVARAALTGGAPALERFSIRLMQPVLPMLAQPAEDIGSALAQLGTAILEWKLDGARVQVHKRGGEVRVYTRNLNDVTARVPEIVERVAALSAQELILDGEAIALRPDGTPHPFQVTMQRFGRKLDVGEMREELPLSVFFFDILYLDGEALIGESTRSRFAALDAVLPDDLRVPRLLDADETKARQFLEAALDHGHEGIMAKSLDAPYEAGRRGAAWLKIKSAHTLDLVVLAAEWGHGRRHGYLSNLHLGARDAESFVMLGKTFKGMTDEMLAWQTNKLLELETAREGHIVYVRPELVVEIAFDSLQASSQYPGGLALRFARVKGYRPDKSAGEADTMDTVRKIAKVTGV